VELAKDTLFGLLFGDETIGTHLERVQRERLTFTLASLQGRGARLHEGGDRVQCSRDLAGPRQRLQRRARDNVILEVEYGEIPDELVGAGIVRCLSLINTLEVNEQILHARMINVEQRTLIE